MTRGRPAAAKATGGRQAAAQAARAPAAARPSRSALRDAEARARLEPIAPGERPAAIVVATAVAALLGIANIAAYALGIKIQGRSAGPSALLFPAVMALAAIGIWRLRYWAVLGFEALLALIVLFFALFLVRAGNLAAVAIALAVVGLGGLLFYKLVHVMGRLQMPGREQRKRDL